MIKKHRELETYKPKDMIGFQFIKVPALIKDKSSIFGEISLNACFFYSFMLDRLNLSIKNNWLDKNGDYYIYYSVNEAQEDMRCSNRKIADYFKELESVGLIRRKQMQGGLLQRIYVLNPYSDVNYSKKIIENREENNAIFRNDESASRNDFLKSLEMTNSHLSYNNQTDMNQTNINHNIIYSQNSKNFNESGLENKDAILNNSIPDNKKSCSGECKNCNCKNKGTALDEEVDKVYAKWQEKAKEYGFAKMDKFTDGRRNKLKTRLKEFKKMNMGVDDVLKAIDKITESDFLCGKKGKWKANWEWFVRPDTIIQILEGKYVNQDLSIQANQGGTKLSRTEEDLERLRLWAEKMEKKQPLNPFDI